mmetsp:Transcript_44833/g.83721  ORF Transcript_44833/g.83721 Transcript_44833/m.83721 type:complete len:117 (+) Transcript_44833:52-402(+)
MFACCAAEEAPAVEEIPSLPVLTEKKAEVPEGAVFTFILPDKSTKNVTFTHKPLGLDFSKSLPMEVKAVRKDSMAEKLEIRPKWILSHVQGEACRTDLKESMTQVLEAVKGLPVMK